jgi:predicted helicase
LYDPYVKFFRWASDRLGKEGIVCLVTNNSFIDQIAFDGMRKHLMQDFTRIYHLHLEGNVRQNPTLSGTAYNVFGIQVGVGITLAIRASKHKDHELYFARVEKLLRRPEKLAWLEDHKTMEQVNWVRIVPDERHTWLQPVHAEEFADLIPLGTKQAKMSARPSESTIFQTYSLGVSTNRDSVVYDFQPSALAPRVEQFVERYNAEVDRYKRVGKAKSPEDFFGSGDIKWSRNLKRFCTRGQYITYSDDALREALYRPFTKSYLYFADIAVDEAGQFFQFYPKAAPEKENRTIIVTDRGSEKPFLSFATQLLCDLHLAGGGAGSQCFPFYVYDEDGSNRRENITDWALKQFQARYGSEKITKWDVFHYVYGLLHHPGYRSRFADNLKRDLPRIPFAPDFQAFADAGRQLADLHLNYESLDPYPLRFVETPDVPLSYVVADKMKLSQDKTSLRVNDSLTLAGIPPEVFDYRLGNRSALEWVIDQYRVSEDARSGIRSDPNRPDDPEYIVRLVGQVVGVSVATVKIVTSLPDAFTT